MDCGFYNCPQKHRGNAIGKSKNYDRAMVVTHKKIKTMQDIKGPQDSTSQCHIDSNKVYSVVLLQL